VRKREHKKTLGTKDPGVAKERHAAEVTRVRAQWRNLETGVRTITTREAQAYAGEIYRRITGAHADEPGAAWIWRSRLNEYNRLKPLADAGDPYAQMRIEEPIADIVDGFLYDEGLVLDDDSHARLTRAVRDAVLQAHGALLKRAEGDFRPDPDADRFPAIPSKGVEFETLFAAYVRARKPSGNTIKRWKPILEKLVAYAGTNDMSRVTEEKLCEWREHLLQGSIEPRTVKDAYIGCAKAFFGWAKRSKHLQLDPAVGVHVEVPRRTKLRDADFTETEARTILSATLAPFSGLISTEHAAARRWVPWICAYTGARVNEITQMRPQDVFCEDGIWVVRITPDAGAQKSREARNVPIHPHLLEQGFVDFAHSCGRPRLFYSEARQKAGTSGLNPTAARMGQKLAEWVRGLGIDDPNVDPNHGWRHRFKTIAIKAGVQERVVDALQGHAPTTVSRKYGKVDIETRHAAIVLIPRYEVVAAESVDRRKLRDKRASERKSNAGEEALEVRLSRVGPPARSSQDQKRRRSSACMQRTTKMAS
jgi:integrase